jgi:hypothetical protein
MFTILKIFLKIALAIQNKLILAAQIVQRESVMRRMGEFGPHTVCTYVYLYNRLNPVNSKPLYCIGQIILKLTGNVHNGKMDYHFLFYF